MIKMSLGEKVKGFLFNPTDTFNAVKAENLGEAFKYFLILLLIFSILFSLIIGIIGTTMIFFQTTMLFPPPAMMGGGLLAVSFFISSFVGGLIAVIIGSLWLHIWVYLVGGRKGLTQTMKAVMYSCTPTFIVGWIPFINIIAMIWAIIVEIIGIRQLHEISTGRAILAWLISILIPGIVLGLLAYYAWYAGFQATPFPKPS
ncbi:hypothetical protein DRN63_00920 [Nanoarchaeota archaeon]|nr:MAG: hypothetical protein DRN63_00920 [Nanoarchaeota archaeon]